MRYLLTIGCLVLLFFVADAQNYQPKHFFKAMPLIEASTPAWAVAMYAPNPNVFTVDSLYKDFYKKNPFKKNLHTQNYKHWRWQIDTYISADGTIQLPSANEELQRQQEIKTRYAERNNSARNGSWYVMGPTETFKENTTQPFTNHKNVYCIDVCVSNPNLLICGTEAGGVYKSTDKGANWSLISRAEPFAGGNTAVKIHPTNQNFFLLSSFNRIYRTLDGGNSWAEVYYPNGSIYEFKFHPNQPDTIFAAGEKGLFRSNDGGNTWTNPITAECHDIDFHPTNPSILYLLRSNTTAKRSEFYRSENGGYSWQLKANGWYSPSNVAQANIEGGKIGVTPASPNMVYVALIGQGKSGDDGWIGVYRSLNKGDAWVNPSGQDGAPYSAINGTAPWNVAAYSDGYHQGFFNFDMEVSPTDPAKIWVGTIRLSESADSAKTFTAIGAADSDRLEDIHADIQGIEVLGNEVWVANDGGISYSNDALMSHTPKIKGIEDAHFWGFSTGWNEDVFIGGKYHTGTSAYYEGYGLGNAQHIGGVEEPSGYVNPLNSRKVYYRTHYGSTETSVKTLSATLGGTTVSHAAMPLYPNESYWDSRSSGIYFDPRYADHVFIGRDNKIYKSRNGGASFEVLYSFPAGEVYEIEISRSNPNVMYAVFKPNSSSCVIYKTTNGGTAWATVTNVPNNRNRLEISINPNDENELWVATSGSNGNKVYQTTNGGSTWTNRTTAALNNEYMMDIMFQGGTTDVVYFVCERTVYQWNGSTWIDYGNGLPAIAKGFRLKPFYRDAELRLGSNGRGAFGRPMADLDFLPQAQPITYRDSLFCAKDTVDFECYSILKHAGASWQWSFSPAPTYVSSLTARNPRVVFGAGGNYDVTLTVTDDNGEVSTKTVSEMIKIEDFCEVGNEAGMALQTTADGDYAAANSTVGQVTHFTITAWIKPNGTQDGFAGIVTNGDWCAHCASANGLIFDYDGEKLWYRWDDKGGVWWDNTGMTVPLDEWSYVAMVVQPDSIFVYLNNQQYAVAATVAPIDFGTLHIGKGFYDNYFKGGIDEVSVWKRALSKNEIRLLRHTTKSETYLANDPALLYYFQFNENLNGEILNKKGSKHASLIGGASQITSSAPVGGGVSERKTINGGGIYDFNNVGVTLRLNDCETPEGELVVTKINQTPHLPTNANANAGSYWVINKYDTNKSFATDTLQLHISDPAFLASLSNPSEAYLHLRSQNSDAFDWTTTATAKAQNSNVLLFGKSNNITDATQFFITDGGAAFTESTPQSYCDADTLPLNAIRLNTNSSHVVTPNINETVTHFTVSAWIKPNGIQNDYAAVLMNNGTGAGLNFVGGNNSLGYHWAGGQWWWNSGLIAPAGEWSHVALVVTPTSVKIYLNGKEATQNINTNAVTLTALRIGSYQGWSDRNFKGEIDEVAIWKRALSRDEIRLMRHLTLDKIVDTDDNLLAYYQFNEGSKVYDKSPNKRHATLNGSPTFVASHATVGGGVSQKATVSTTGQHNFATPGVTLHLPSGGTTPNGELVVTRLHYTPPTDSLPQSDHLGYFWVINNYGTNQTFSPLTHLKLAFKDGVMPLNFATAEENKLFRRSENQYRKQWTAQCQADSVRTGNAAALIFGGNCTLDAFSQLHVFGAEAIVPVRLLTFDAENINNERVALRWTVASEDNFSHYEIQRAADGANFETIALVQPDPSLNYEEYDNAPLKGNNFYRLKMVDLDDSFAFSPIKAVFISETHGSNKPVVAPNPIKKGETFTIRYPSLANSRFRIFNADGKLVFDAILQQNIETISTEKLAAGVHFYTLMVGNQIFTGKLVVY